MMADINDRQDISTQEGSDRNVSEGVNGPGQNMAGGDGAPTEVVGSANEGSVPPEGEGAPKKPQKKHLIRPAWLRIPLKVLMWLFIIVLLIPVLLYLPPVQDFAVKVAQKVVHDKTGMTIGIGKLRLSYPIDVHLKDVYVIQASGDTMVRAGEAIADVKLLPLLHLDVQVNKLRLNDGYFRMVSPDTSMILAVKAGFLEVDDKSSVNIKTSDINLNKVKLRDGQLSMFMDVWKKKPAEPDTATSKSAPFRIVANDLDIQNFRFGMSMLPTIDTMDVAVRHIAIKDANIDLGENLVRWGLASIAGGSFKYLTPTAEYIKNHPAPPSQPSAGPPMRIMGDSIAVDSLSALYAVKDARPQPGFDPGYLEFSDIKIAMKDFYNESSTVRLPLKTLQARERSGLQVMSGSGTVGIDSIGLKLDKIDIRTLFSTIKADADVPFALMALQPDANMWVKANGRIGLPDIETFVPTLKPITSKMPARKPLDFDINADGSLADLVVNKLAVLMPGVVSVKASGFAKNPLEYKKMKAHLDFDGSLSDPALADRLVKMPDMRIPAFTIKGSADANGMNYGADFTLRSDAGDVDAVGHVALTPENYSADVKTIGLDVGRFVPNIGIGRVTADIKADGHGFNPLSGKAVTDAIVNVSSIQYNGRDLRDIRVAATLSNQGDFNVIASSVNPGLDFDLNGNGTIHTDDYKFDIQADLRDVNLEQLGLTDSICYGSGYIAVNGSAQPGKWIYDVNLDAKAIEWHLPDQYIHLPDGVVADVKTDPLGTVLKVNSLLTTVDFTSPSGLERLIKGFTAGADMAMRQVKEKNLAVDSLSRTLPQFKLDVNASGRGLISQLLQSSGMRLDTVSVKLENDSLISGDIFALNFSSPSIQLDTMTLQLKERGNLLDYKAHLGNRPGTLDEFARVNLNGYLGNNRASAFLNQWNVKGEQGYRIGLTAALADSVISAHITPLKSTIAYLPWTFNNDNFVDFNLHSKKIEANLKAQSAESSILAKTQYGENGNEELYLNIDNLHIQDFLRMWALAPDMKGDLNADMHITYDDRRFKGNGTLGLNNFVYEKTTLGNFDLDLDAAYGMDSSTDLTAALKINGQRAIAAYANLVQGPEGLKPDSVGVSLTRFPLNVANPFLGKTVTLSGYLNGDMRMDGSFSDPRLNGSIAFDSVTANIPMIGAALNFREDRLAVEDNVVTFPDFKIFAANDNPLVINGTVNARKFSNIIFDLTANAQNMQLIKSDKRSKSDLYGKIFFNLGATVKGPMKLLDINGNVNILNTTDATYRLNMEPAQLTTQSDQDVVKFVNFRDTTLIAKEDTVVESPLNMRINANLVITPGARLGVDLDRDGKNKVELNPSANLNYYQNYMGDMTVTGTLTLGDGYARYSFPVVGEKMFTFDPASTVTWTGDVLNPTLNITATDEVKANVSSNGNSRLVNFLVSAHITNTLQNLGASFDLSTDDDMTIQNELKSMSADQRQTQAMNLLLYGQYMGQNTKTNSAPTTSYLYSFLESQINAWAAKNIRAVDLSFGVNQYDKTTNGVTNTETSYSYQISKSLFNNRFKILVGGNYSTESAEDEIAQNLVSDVAFEYMIKQTQTTSMAVKVFRHTGFESILEGEVTEMGGAFVLKRRIDNLKNLFRFKRRKKTTATQEIPTDTLNKTVDDHDSIPK